MSYADAHAVIMCFSVDNRDSLENIPNRWLAEISEYCPEAKVLLVALKCDLRDNEEFLKRKNIEPILYEEVRIYLLLLLLIQRLLTTKTFFCISGVGSSSKH